VPVAWVILLRIQKAPGSTPSGNLLSWRVFFLSPSRQMAW